MRDNVGSTTTFFRESNPQPLKHTVCKLVLDFTEGQASRYRWFYKFPKCSSCFRISSVGRRSARILTRMKIHHIRKIGEVLPVYLNASGISPISFPYSEESQKTIAATFSCTSTASPSFMAYTT